MTRAIKMTDDEIRERMNTAARRAMNIEPVNNKADIINAIVAGANGSTKRGSDNIGTRRNSKQPEPPVNSEEDIINAMMRGANQGR